MCGLDQQVSLRMIYSLSVSGQDFGSFVEDRKKESEKETLAPRTHGPFHQNMLIGNNGCLLEDPFSHLGGSVN